MLRDDFIECRRSKVMIGILIGAIFTFPVLVSLLLVLEHYRDTVISMANQYMSAEILSIIIILIGFFLVSFISKIYFRKVGLTCKTCNCILVGYRADIAVSTEICPNCGERAFD